MIVQLTGGLCNQFFIYAYGQGLSQHRNEPVQYCWQRSTWDYGLDKYAASDKIVLVPKSGRRYDEKTFEFYKEPFEQPSDTYFVGYFQNEKYFPDPQILRTDLTLKDQPSYKVEREADFLQNTNSVFIHVRRGDYLNPGTIDFHGSLGLDYYNRAIEYVKERVDQPTFVIFSDDAEWCRQNFPYEVISGKFDRHEDLYLMSCAKHGIMSNSSYAWWGNWLGDYPGRVVVAPKQWFKNPFSSAPLIPERWRTM